MIRETPKRAPAGPLRGPFPEGKLDNACHYCYTGGRESFF
jgi:hypothetical protein